MNPLKQLLRRLLGADEEEQRFHATFNRVVATEGHLRGVSGLLLDVGARDAVYTRRFLDAVNACGDNGPWSVVATDVSPAYLSKARERFTCLAMDAERQDWPLRSRVVSCVILNQLLEHLHDPFHVLGEADRVLKVGGLLLIGVPNLAGLVNRCYLLLGRQPPAVHFPGPHPRGYTFRAMRNFLATNPNFTLIRSFGACCYPFPPPLSEWAGRRWPSGASFVFFVARKVADRQPSPWFSGREATGETVFRP